MKFSHKVFFSTLFVAMLIFSVGTSILLRSVFSAAMEREEYSTRTENQMLRFSFVTAASGIMTTSEYYSMFNTLSDSAVRRIAASIESSNGMCIRVTGGDGAAVYTSAGFRGNDGLIQKTQEGVRTWMSFRDETGYYMISSCVVNVGEHIFYLENQRDISNIMADQHGYLRLYQILAVCLMLLSAVIALLLSAYLTRPMKQLSAVSRRIAGGEYWLRCEPESHDEIGALTEDFNAMSDSLETKIRQLQDASKRQEDFIASFAHELKTPLTSIIGYGDMLRTQILSPEQQFKAASYICTEGKRLECLSYKLLDFIVYGKKTIDPTRINAPSYLTELGAVLAPSYEASGVTLEISAQPGEISGESDLLKSLIVNLCDNARKASAVGGTVRLTGTWESGGYRIAVSDSGCGIPAEELEHITEPFYMVDKSRDRAKNGAGLGLALCAVVAELHGTALEFESRLGEGTTVSVLLKEAEP